MKFPSFTHFARAVARFFKRPELVPMLVETERDMRCLQCPANERGQCQLCTCVIALKTKFSTESCPAGRWREYFNPRNNGL